MRWWTLPSLPLFFLILVGRVAERTAKQAMAAILKAFAVPAASDPSCVTSYTNGLDQFDRKGSRPNARSSAIFKSNLSRMRSEWQRFKNSH